LWRPLAKLLHPFGRLTLEVLLERDLTRPVQRIKTDLDISIRLAGADDLDWITALYARVPYLYLGDHPETGQADARPMTSCGSSVKIETSAREQYASRFERGERCFIASVAGEVAHVNWLCFHWGEAVPGHPIVLEEGEAYTTDAVTVAKFRGKNVHALVLGEMLRAAQQAGRLRALTATRADRHASFNAFSQLGWRVCGQVLCLVPRGGGSPKLMKLSGDIAPLLRGKTPARSPSRGA